MLVFRIKDRTKRICDHCTLIYPECPNMEYLDFGEGLRNDNIIACSEYAGPITNEVSIDKNIDIQQKR